MASQVNGPTGMYKIKPFFETNEQIELPTCMYKCKNYHSGFAAGEQVNASSSSDSDLVELEKRQETILAKLETLRSKVEELSKRSGHPQTSTSVQQGASSRIPLSGVVKDLVINANPENPPLSIAVLYQLLSQQYSIMSSCHTHSSVKNAISEKLKQPLGSYGMGQSRRHSELAVTLIWKDVKHGPTLMVSPNIQTLIEGEGPVARYIARLLNPAYDTGDIVTATEIDQYVDLSASLLNGNNKEKAGVLRTLNGRLGKAQYLVGDQVTLADIVLWSAVHQSKQADSAPTNVKKWLDRCAANPSFGLAQKLL